MKEKWDLNSQKLGILLRNFADMIWEYDTETHRLFAEPECSKRCGLPEIVADGARGLVDAGVLHPDYLPSLSHLFHSLEIQDCTLTALSFLHGLVSVVIIIGIVLFSLLLWILNPVGCRR